VSDSTVPAGQDRPIALIIDDDPTVRLLVGECLRETDFTVHEANDGEEGLEAYRHIRPEIVLLDVLMPKLDGFGVCEAIRACPEGQHVPILMMTGLDDVDSINRAYEVGATDFITKPLSYALLRYRVRYLRRAARNLEQLHKSEQRLARAQRIAKLGHWEWNPRRNDVHVSGEIEHLFRVQAEGKRSEELADEILARVPEDEHDRLIAAFRTLLSTRRPLGVKHRFRLPDGTLRVVEQQAEFSSEEQHGESSITATAQDVTDEEAAAERIRHLAYHDSLTGLPNRESFKECMRQALDLAKRPKRRAAILFLDLDDFKRINDTLSHRIGDLLLERVAERIIRILRACDRVSRWVPETEASRVARLGGDEFTVLLSEIREPEDAALVADRLLRELAKPYMVAGNEIFVTVSIGIAVHPVDGDDVDRLLMNADTAMYHAKGAGKNVYRFYSESMNASALDRLAMETSLRRAIARNELFLCFQPQIDLKHGGIGGLEALARWRSGDQGMIGPAEFVPIAESCGLILEIGRWVLAKACRCAQRWQAAGRAVPVAVNVSGVQFRQPGMIDEIAEILGETGLDPALLELELTETVIMEGGHTNIDRLAELKEIGVRLAIDDFGTGYSSLSYLKQFPINALKIDRSFVKDLGVDRNDAAIARGIIAIAHGLDLEVIAEGVESKEQLDFLRAHHCDKVQGYLLGQPMHEDDVPRLLDGHPVEISTLLRDRESPTPEA
jgi:diguanylate cyclase (GGDEF)-like protein